MPVAGLLDIWLTSISDFDASVHCGFAGGLLAELLNMVTSRYRGGGGGGGKREHRALGCRVCRRRDGVAMQLSMLRKK